MISPRILYPTFSQSPNKGSSKAAVGNALPDSPAFKRVSSVPPSYLPYSGIQPPLESDQAAFHCSASSTTSLKNLPINVALIQNLNPVSASLRYRYQLIDALPKAELHVHLFGTLTPELLFKVAQRNHIPLPYTDVDALKKEFVFKDLSQFVKMHDKGVSVFRTESDFYDITYEYLKKLHSQNVRYLELIFDPQLAKPNGVAFKTELDGIERAIRDGETQFGIKTNLILTFVRHLGVESAMETLRESIPYRDKIAAVGLAGIEKNHPPEAYAVLFQKASELGYKSTAHYGEDQDWRYIESALDQLKLDRLDHGFNCLQNPQLVQRLRVQQIPLTICPVSNCKIGYFPFLGEHPLKQLLDAGLLVSINSDDPSYFKADLNENYKAATEALDLNEAQLIQLAKNSFLSAFITPAEKAAYLQQIDAAVTDFHTAAARHESFAQTAV